MRQIIGFRNILVHGSAEVQDDRVWDTAAMKVPGLLETFDRLLASAHRREQLD
ncbi:HepT-like ribonuclease domain-containing protein [Ornithinicoccus hortensis]|uniref:HepT-like ribonuclease domain-containing protein n=1 Tax=Ornithinicoccus hortensis TaxID=82346 RepID=UPI001154C529